VCTADQSALAHGGGLVRPGNRGEAEPVREEARASRLAFPKQSRAQMVSLYTALASVYDGMNQPEKAAAARVELGKWRATSRPTTTRAAAIP